MKRRTPQEALETLRESMRKLNASPRTMTIMVREGPHSYGKTVKLMSPYRETTNEPYPQPSICADCKHLKRVTDYSQFWRCRATPALLTPAHRDPVSGRWIEDEVELGYCYKKNAEADCKEFSPTAELSRRERFALWWQNFMMR